MILELFKMTKFFLTPEFWGKILKMKKNKNENRVMFDKYNILQHSKDWKTNRKDN